MSGVLVMGGTGTVALLVESLRASGREGDVLIAEAMTARA